MFFFYANKNVEFIFINDDSTDGNLKLLIELSSKAGKEVSL